MLPVIVWVIEQPAQFTSHPTNATDTHSPDAGIMLHHCLRHWIKIQPTLWQCFVIAEEILHQIVLFFITVTSKTSHKIFILDRG